MCDDWHSQVPRREGEFLDYVAQPRILRRISDWSDPERIQINRGGKQMKPVAELRKRIFQLPWNRPKR